MRHGLGSLGGSSLGGNVLDASPRTGAANTLFTTYGTRAARVVMAGAMVQPEANRTAFLKATLDKIDPTLWGRAEVYADALSRVGVSDSSAVEAGIARAMSEGIVRELVATGRTGAVKKQSQLGLAALGAATMTSPQPSKTAPTIKTAASTQEAVAAACKNPPPGFTWTGTSWARVAVGAAPKAHPGPGCYVIDSRTHLPGSAPLRPGNIPVAPSVPVIQVGPFQVPVDAVQYVIAGPTIRDHTGALGTKPVWDTLPAEWRKKLGDMIVAEFQHLIQAGAITIGGCQILIPASDLGITIPPLGRAVPPSPDDVALGVQGMHTMTQDEIDSNARIKQFRAQCEVRNQWDEGGWIPESFIRPTRPWPLFVAVHPVSGKNYGMFIVTSPIAGANIGNKIRKDVNPDGVFYHASGPIMFQWREIPPVEKSAWNQAWDTFTKILPYLIFPGLLLLPIPGNPLLPIIEDIVGEVAGLACQVANNPLAQVGAGAAGGPAGAVGVTVVQNLCNGQPPPVTLPPPQPQQSSSMLPLALAGGAGLLILLVAMRKKK